METMECRYTVNDTDRCRYTVNDTVRCRYIIESVDSISKDERGFPLTQYITNGRISRGGYTFTHFKHHHRVLAKLKIAISVSYSYSYSYSSTPVDLPR